MDALAGLLDGPRARGAFLLRIQMDDPWAVRLEDEAPLSLSVVTRGSAWVRPDDGEPVLLDVGDLVVWVGTDPWTLAGSPTGAPTALVLPGQECRTPDGRSLETELHQGVRTWGNAGADAGTVLLTGVYLAEGEVSARLVRALPRMVVLRADDLDPALVGLLTAEVARQVPGQEAVLDRLLDLLLVTVLRTWFERDVEHAPQWWAAQSDAVVGRALRLLQHHPERPWTVAHLADETGLSRAAFARRFAALVGQPPMAFLTEWRLALAADLLLEPGTTIASVARRVGYASPFALSAAFKRERGVSPREHRVAGLAGLAQ
jgi:AraC-like DNA-binding protein